MADQYIREYTTPTPAEAVQLYYKRALKRDFPDWDDTLIRATKHTEPLLPAKAVLLDVGCGHGNWIVDELHATIGTAIGVDVDPEAVTKNTSMDRVIVSRDLNHPQLTPGSFDIATALWVLEHVADPKTVFQQVERLLKPGGYFVFVTPFKHSILIAIRRLFNLVARDLGTLIVAKVYGRADKDIFPTHYRANDPDTVARIAKTSGLTVVLLETNFCPSYTTCNSFTYWLNTLAYRSGLRLFHPHLIGILQKPLK
jgi:2-polyprenyl-3-methyl-5-hydroxy-6-metoxy-1,4-benzoquinol methylase